MWFSVIVRRQNQSVNAGWSCVYQFCVAKAVLTNLYAMQLKKHITTKTKIQYLRNDVMFHY